MPYVSLIVEFLRARPGTVFWIAALSQAAPWVLVPTLFYFSPPGDLPEVLAIGREWQPGFWQGPPLAFWLADVAFRIAGDHAFGVYVLSQACVVIALWALFTLGRAMVGAQQSAMAVLLMTGVVLFTAPTPEFGPAILALALWPLALKHYWFAVGLGRRRYWLALAIDLGLLLLTTYWGWLLVVMLAAFTIATREGRAALRHVHPWAGAALALMIPFPHYVWLYQLRGAPLKIAVPDLSSGYLLRFLLLWLFLLLVIAASHFGLGVLTALASGAGVERRMQAPKIERDRLLPLARPFTLTFAIFPFLCATLIWAALNQPVSPAWGAVFVVMSGLAIVVLARDSITLHRQNVLGVVWLALLIVPPAAIIAAALLGPWTIPYELNHQQPSAALGQFFTDTFRRRTGKPLEVVVGDTRPAYLLVANSPDRPRIFSAATPAQTPWLSEADVHLRGAVVIWELEDQAGQAPDHLRERFPELVPEVPRTFLRPIPGILPSYRVGWAVIRPQATARAD